MKEISYRPLIEGMKWSYSRLTSFEDCPYRWFLKYICKETEKPQFYSSYGTLMHKLIEQYYRGKLSKDEMLTQFLLNFSKEVQGERPSDTIVQKYITSGVDYLRNFKAFPFEMVDVEKRIDFDVHGIPFVGVIDYIGTKNGELYIVDNKSRDLKPRGKRKKPTVKDGELDEMLRQLYLYSAAVKQVYGMFPKALCFNCFKTGVFIEEPFDPEVYEGVIRWTVDLINEIADTEEFYPSIEYFKCRYICGVREECCYCDGM